MDKQTKIKRRKTEKQTTEEKITEERKRMNDTKYKNKITETDKQDDNEERRK